MTVKNTKSSFSILFVDDEENARKYFAKALQNEFNVLTAANVSEAQKILIEKNNEIAVVISDQRMPGGNGVILLKFLRENYPHIIRLLTTAYSDLSDAIEAVNGGEILRYIQKPWDFTMLKAEMEQALELFELRMERSQIIQEKIMVKKKMAKVERVKSLILFAKYFSFLKNSETSISNFIKEFVDVEIPNENEENWQSFDFGSYDILETKFLTKLIEKLQKEIPFNNYEINEKLNSDLINQVFSQLNKNSIANNLPQILGEVNGEVNLEAFSILLKQLIEINNSVSSANLSFEDKINQISLKTTIKKLSDFSKNNLFIVNPTKEPSQLYVNLIVCYLIATHHNGFIKISYNEDEMNLEILLPKKPQEALIENSEINIENLILSSMLY